MKEGNLKETAENELRNSSGVYANIKRKPPKETQATKYNSINILYIFT